jgi:Holliday junction resolvase-like predicted endonuclease
MFGFLGHMIFLFFSVCKRGERNERVKSAVTKKKKQKIHSGARSWSSGRRFMHDQEGTAKQA